MIRGNGAYFVLGIQMRGESLKAHSAAHVICTTRLGDRARKANLISLIRIPERVVPGSVLKGGFNERNT